MHLSTNESSGVDLQFLWNFYFTTSQSCLPGSNKASLLFWARHLVHNLSVQNIRGHWMAADLYYKIKFICKLLHVVFIYIVHTVLTNLISVVSLGAAGSC